MTSGRVEATHDVEQRIREVFAAAGATGYLCVREVGGPVGVEVGADDPVAAASVIKVLVAVAFARAVDAGTVDPAERVVVPAALRIGGSGTAGCADEVTMTLRDLALFMMSVSDNAATDIVAGRVGHDAVNQVADDLGLVGTRFVADMHTLHQQVVDELGLGPAVVDLDTEVRAAGDRVWHLAWIDPRRTNRSTARETAALLEAIWTDRAASPAACAHARELLSHQVTTHRLAAGFDDDVLVASKTGTIPAVRNDAGCVTYPDGRRYVAAVFTRAGTLADRRPEIDTAIGRSARMAIDHLRANEA